MNALLFFCVGVVLGGGFFSKCNRKTLDKKNSDLILLVENYNRYGRRLFLFLSAKEFVMVAMTNRNSWKILGQIIQDIFNGSSTAIVEKFLEKSQNFCITHTESLIPFHVSKMKIYISKMYAEGVPDELLKSAHKISPKVLDYGTQIVFLVPDHFYLPPDFFDIKNFWFILRLIDLKPMGPVTFCTISRGYDASLHFSRRYRLVFVVEYEENCQIFKIITEKRERIISKNDLNDRNLPRQWLQKKDTFVVFTTSSGLWRNYVCFVQNGKVKVQEMVYPTFTTMKTVQKSFDELENIFQNGSGSIEEISKWQEKYKKTSSFNYL